MTTLGDVLELSGCWLDGDYPFHPHFGSVRGDDLTRLSPFLAGATRAGWLIHGYQPGFDAADAQQRAYVEGYCNRDLSTWIRNAGLDLDLHVELRNPGLIVRPTTDVTEIAQRVVARVGGRPHPEELLIYASAGVPAGIVESVSALPYVTVVDLEWHRADRVPALLSRITGTFGDRFTGGRDANLGDLVEHRPPSEDHWVASRSTEPVIPSRQARREADDDTSWPDQGWDRVG